MPSCNVNWCCEKMPLIMFGSKFPDGLESSFPICNYLVFLLSRVFQHSLELFSYLKKTKHCVIPIQSGVIPGQTKLKIKLETIYWNKLRCNKQAKACLANNSTKHKIPGFLCTAIPVSVGGERIGAYQGSPNIMLCRPFPGLLGTHPRLGWIWFFIHPVFLLALHIQQMYTSMSTAIPVQ